MPYFAVHYTYVSEPGALDDIRPAHRAFLGSLAGGALVASGPLVDTAPPSALLIMQADSATAVEELLDEDPFWVASLIVERRVDEWNPVIGVFAASVHL